MKVSVIVPYFGNAPSLIKVLETLVSFSQQHNVEVIVVNDGSPDYEQYEEVIRRHMCELPLSKMLILSANSGRSVARNEGAKAASFPNLMFLDADRMLDYSAFGDSKFKDENYVESRIRIGPLFETYNEVQAISSGREFILSPTMVRKYGYYKFLEQAFDGFGNINLNNPWIATFSGAMLISKDNFTDLNGFDTSFKTWGMENLEFGYRAFQKNISYSVQSDFVTYHITHGRNENFYSKNIETSVRLFYKKWHDPKILALQNLLDGKISLGQFDSNSTFENSYYYRLNF